MEFINKDKISKLVILALLALTLPLAAGLVGQRQEIRKEAAGSGVVKLTLDPSSGSKARGQAFTVINVKMTATQAKQIYAGEVKLQFQSTVFDISNIACGSNFPMKVQGNVSGDNINLICSREGGTAAFTFTANAPVILGSFRATVKNNAPLGTSTVSFVSTKIPEATTLTDISDAGTTATYTITVVTPTNTPRPPTPTPTGGAGPTPTPTPTGGATRTVNLITRLRGVDQPPTIVANQTLNFKVKFVRAGAAPSFFEPQGLAPVTGGNWTIPIVANTLPAGQYEVYIKGPKHLQKKFPKVVLDGSASQTIDLTTLGERYYLEPGDLAISGPNKDQQDGVVNAMDAVYLTSTCGLYTEDAACLAKADLDLDGQINAIDIALMNATVYSKWEDEVE